MKIRTIIVDDEPRAHKVLESYIARIPEMELTGNFLNAISAREFVQQNTVDLILLDITMPELSGFDMARLLKDPPLIIFTTAHPEFALESYEYEAVDYLTKPVPFDRFAKGIAKASRLIALKGTATPELNSIQLRVDGENVVIPFSDLLYFQSLGNYVKVITTKKQLISHITTAEIEMLVPRTVFLRTHKSFIINRSKIASCTEDEIVIGGSTLPIGKTFKKYVKELLAS